MLDSVLLYFELSESNQSNGRLRDLASDLTLSWTQKPTIQQAEKTTSFFYRLAHMADLIAFVLGDLFSSYVIYNRQKEDVFNN